MNKNILFSIVVVIASILIIAFAMTTYRYYQAIHSDDPISPYLAVEQGKATITRGKIAIDMMTPESYEVAEGDIIITRADSLAVVNWPDHSMTRLGSNSRLTIERMRVADDYSKIELVASLESGKVWSNIVRTLYPESRVEFHLPKNGTVAGVRGTVFEINLDANYIHSIDHSVALSNSIGQLVTLMPGDSVSASNILTKIGTKLDTAWITANTLRDSTYMMLRNVELRDTYTRLSHSTGGIFDLWDRFVRWILSFFSGFDAIRTLSVISSGNISDIGGLSQATVMRWYQSFQSTDFVQERDQFRGVIISLRDQFTGGDQIIESLTRGAMWDMMSASGAPLQNSKGLLDTYAKKTGTTLDSLISGARSIDASKITEGGRAIYDRLMR
ncbi:FecR domain-containing protein [Candidatus Gracilibacteria bacterium]|nr:FecR domain-containing protein [Candidatus Gracilibacteria bacterium]